MARTRIHSYQELAKGASELPLLPPLGGTDDLDDAAIILAGDEGAPLLWEHLSVFAEDEAAEPFEVEALALVPPRDPAAAYLHPSALVKYDQAVVAYLAMQGHVHPYLPLQPSVRRRTLQQAVCFYEPWVWYRQFGGPRVPNANIPGTSIHEYGYALDLVLEKDTRRTKRALRDTGWVADKPAEPWHFEARSAAGYQAALNYSAATVRPATTNYTSRLIAVLKSRNLYERNKTRYEADRARLEPERVRLLRAAQDLNGRRTVLSNERARLDREQRRLTNERGTLARLRRQVQGKAYRNYDRCPNKQSWNDCTHAQLKNQWEREKRALEQEYSTRAARLARAEQAYVDAERLYRDAAAHWQQDHRDYLAQKAVFDRAYAQFYQLWKTVIAAEADFNGWPDEREQLIAPIQRLVNAAPR